MKYYLIAVERSGDMHGANLMRAILKRDDQAEFRYVGGEQMAEVGGESYLHFQDVSVMGIWEVVRKARQLKRIIREVAADLERFEPAAFIMIDGSSFNLRISKLINRTKLKTFFYIPPKRWAYLQNRTKKMVGLIDHMLCILPFEKTFFESYGIKSHYVGNPIMDQIEQFSPSENLKSELSLDNRPIALILPGSREQEVTKILSRSSQVISEMVEYQWIVAGVNNLPKSLYSNLPDSVNVVFDRTYDLLNIADIAVVASGTATLETALFKVPQVVVYRTSFITAMAFKLLANLEYVSLANFVAGEKVIPELLQYEFTTEKLLLELKRIRAGEGRDSIMDSYDQIIDKVGESGTSNNAAAVILKQLEG
jgi:lipid-A-disaccharide synthase